MAAATVVLPGDEVPSELLPTSQNPNKPLTLGPGLRHIPPSTIQATIAGALIVDTRKHALWIEHNGGRYIPTQNDLVIATVHHSSTDSYHCSLTPYTPLATLGQLAFEGVTRKTRPVLAPGALVYARISLASKHMDPEIECVSATTGKAEGMGPLKGGMVFDVSLGMARRLMMPEKRRGEAGLVVLDELAERFRFEVAVGRNGRVWVDGGDVRSTVVVGRALVECDEKGLTVEEQRILVKRVSKGL